MEESDTNNILFCILHFNMLWLCCSTTSCVMEDSHINDSILQKEKEKREKNGYGGERQQHSICILN